MAAPVYQAVVDTGGATAANFTTPTLAAVANDIIVVAAYLEPSVTVTPPDGTWTEKDTAATTQSRLRVWWHRATGAETTYVFTHASTFRRAIGLKISGCITSGDPFDDTDVQFDNASAATTPGVTVATVGADRLLVWSATEFQGGDSFTSPSGITERVDTASITAGTGDFLTQGSTGSLSGTCATSTERIAWLGALAPPTTSGPTGLVARTVRRQIGRLRGATYVVLVPSLAVEAGGVGVAGTAAATAAAQDATVAVVQPAGTATATAAAQDATAGVVAMAQTATVTAAAQDAVAVTTQDAVAVAGTANVTAAAQNATVAVGPVAETALVAVEVAIGVSHEVAASAETALVTAAAQDAVAVVVQGGVGGAQTATVTAAAQDATVAVVAMAETATVTAAAQNATATFAVTALAETAAVAAAAQDATVAIVQPAGTATVAAAAQDATAGTVTAGAAETALVAATAQDATVAVVAMAQTATVTAAAQNASVAGTFTAQTASVTATANDATVAIAQPAGTALVAAQAQDAVVFIPPPVPPPRWVEHDATATSLTEGDSTGSGLVEGVLVGAGIVEGGSSL